MSCKEPTILPMMLSYTCRAMHVVRLIDHHHTICMARHTQHDTIKTVSRNPKMHRTTHCTTHLLTWHDTPHVVPCKQVCRVVCRVITMSCHVVTMSCHEGQFTDASSHNLTLILYLGEYKTPFTQGGLTVET